jgi:hypothetical protein
MHRIAFHLPPCFISFSRLLQLQWRPFSRQLRIPSAAICGIYHAPVAATPQPLFAAPACWERTYLYGIRSRTSSAASCGIHQPPSAATLSRQLRQPSAASCGNPQPLHLSGNIQWHLAVAPQPLQVFSRLFLSQDHCRHVGGLGFFIVL